MKRIMFLAIVLTLAFFAQVQAAPFLVCDSPPAGETRTSYQFTGDAWFTTHAAEADGSLRYDLAGITTVAHNPTIKSCNLWGCSSGTPFSFTPGNPSNPLNIRVIATLP